MDKSNAFNEEFLKEEGFEGFQAIHELCARNCQQIPEAPGVYIISHHPAIIPEFLAESPAYRFKNRNPSVSVERLGSKWINGAEIYYVGRAKGLSSNSTLQKRVNCLIDFGQGRAAAHWGGRYIWQLRESQDLIISWKECSSEESPRLEIHYLKLFKSFYGRLPFANLRH